VASLAPVEEDAAVAVLDVGHRLTSICIVGPDGVEFARSLSGGGLEITSQLAQAFKVNLAKAEAGKHKSGFIESAERTAGSPEQVLISDTIKRALSPVIRELRQSLTAHQSLVRRPVARIWLCGGTSAIPNLDTHLEAELGIQVQRIQKDHFDLAGVQDVATEGDNNTWVKALGLAMHAHQGGRRDWLNLRRGPFAFKGDFEYMRGKVLYMAAALLIMAFLAIGYAVTRYLSLSNANQSMDTRMCEVTQAILGKCYQDPEVAISIIKDKVNPEELLLPEVTALDVLREMHERVPEDFKLRYKDVNISPKKIRVTGFTESFEAVETIKAELEKYKCFKDIATGRTQMTTEGSEVEFRFTIAFGC
jgi:general secretion pathway protein L